MYDLETNQWSTLGDLKEGRVYFNVVSTFDGLMAIGGYDGEKVLNSCEVLDEETNEWETIESLNSKRMNSAVVYNDG